ncbi:PREDICTED: uncharacterized protein LOC109582203 [Amphimedon queenslandica]|uniref:Fibronectin type-III domain-containing protein n=1 Tax=Amphimedon queenslandica TaxID=400682 RepID=A0AAN0J6Q9_AMPQE|nr:PREDICTED: uncharacterized protein LOC109582203 [Amphimedon queenslandica]|eukprot:XP_019852411.1 PREDICTED: uncharacterized protein LOC109582203 [Amphimedon queenslandica]
MDGDWLTFLKNRPKGQGYEDSHRCYFNRYLSSSGPPELHGGTPSWAGACFCLLDSVSNLNYTFINESSTLLTWIAPYSLDNVPITGYYIVNGLVDITTINNNTNITLLATNPDPCILNNVSVSPINDVGIGSSNDISFYKKGPNVQMFFSGYNATSGIAILHLNISVTLPCTDEVVENVTVIIHCNKTVVYADLIPVENSLDVIESVPVPLNQQCDISIVFSNEDGSSAAFMLPLDHPVATSSLPSTATTTSSPSGGTSTSSPTVTTFSSMASGTSTSSPTVTATSPPVLIIIAATTSFFVLLLMAVLLSLCAILLLIRKHKKKEFPVVTLVNNHDEEPEIITAAAIAAATTTTTDLGALFPGHSYNLCYN